MWNHQNSDHQIEPLLTSGSQRVTRWEQLEIENPPQREDTTERFRSWYSQENIVYPTNFFSTLTFRWIYNLLKIGSKAQIKINSLGKIGSSLTAKEFLNELKPKWYGKFQYEKKYPLFRAVIAANFIRILMLFILSTLSSVIELISIYLFRQILLAFQTKDESKESPILQWHHLIVIMLLFKFVDVFIRRRTNFLIDMVCSRATVSLNSIIFDKLLQVATFNKDSFSEGEWLNFVQIDSEKFGHFLSDSPRILILPFQMFFYIIWLFKYFGPSFLFGFAFLVWMIWIVAFILKRRAKWQKQYMNAKDLRMKTTTELFNIIKTIKLNSWEEAFLKKIDLKRENELNIWLQVNNYQLFVNCLYWSAPIILTLVSIIFYNVFNSQMETANIVTSMYIFSAMSDPWFSIPEFFNGLLESIISWKRIEKFLYSRNTDSHQIEHLPPESPVAISIENCSFGLDKTDISSVILLKDINLQINKGELIACIGEVGSGKSCWWNAVINNLEVFSKYNDKNIKINGEVSYVSQNPWILNDTIKNNILFFKEYNEKKYLKVIEMCELNQDISLLPGGDMTEIGEKGANLSGGQKARLAIARAIYSDSDIYWFDDPLSALDAYVGMKIFNQVILGYWKQKTRVISTHALQYISYTNKVIYMNQGKIEWYGKAKEWEELQWYQDFVRSWSNRKKSDAEKDNKVVENGAGYSQKEEGEQTKLTANNTTLTVRDDDSIQVNVKNGVLVSPGKTENEIVNKRIVRITKDEEQEHGGIKFKVWWAFYLYAGGVCYFTITITLNWMWKAFDVGSDYYWTFWTSKSNLSKSENTKSWLIYTFVTWIGVCLVFFRAKYMVIGLIRFNKNIHDIWITTLVKAPLNWFHDTIPRGQILNRMNKDLENSTRLNNVSSGTLRMISEIWGALVILSIFNIYSLIVIPLLFFLEGLVYRFFSHTGHDLNRLEGNSRSPIISVFLETIPGLPIIRAYHFENNFTNKFHQRLNDFFKVQLFLSGGANWWGLNLDLISFFLLAFVLLFSLFFQDIISSQAMGLLLGYSIKMIESVQHAIKRITLLENLLTSVERCHSFTQICQERSKKTEIDTMLPDFPKYASIKFENFSVRYRPQTDLVLKNLTFSIQAGEKIGVVGRTGSGKSTLCLCLFRIWEADSGVIKIDGTDISKLGLDKWRDSITMIPQEPTLIEGDWRENIDPAGKENDAAWTEALISVGLEDWWVSKGWNYQIVENGNNLSIGEKQLLCIARALLRKSKIVLMDEATSSIDYKTESIIQRLLNTAWKQSTVITIAHRIKTIINYDKILVLSNGEIAEFDTVKALLANKKGLFYELYKESAI